VEFQQASPPRSSPSSVAERGFSDRQKSEFRERGNRTQGLRGSYLCGSEGLSCGGEEISFRSRLEALGFAKPLAVLPGAHFSACSGRYTSMSTAGAATAASSDGGAASASRAGLESSGGRNARAEKKAGRGRRRRAAGEQRRNEHQRWGQYLDDDDEDFSLVDPSLPGSRRRNSDRHELEQYLDRLANDVVDPDVALALSISIAERNSASQVEGLPASVIAGMTYESLAQLEDVRCAASAGVVTALPVCSFLKEEEAGVSDACSLENEHAEDSRMCVICQGEYDDGDVQVRLPCLHMFHQVCGSEWLLNYSKLCPICKHDVTEVAAEAT
jgi:hypothetical protein